MKPDAITWAVMLTLVSTSGVACKKSTVTPNGDAGAGVQTDSYPVGHPCHGRGNCSGYRRLADGGVAGEHDTDAGSFILCGPCNG